MPRHPNSSRARLGAGVLMILASLLAIGADAPAQERAGPRVELQGQFDQEQFAAGEEVRISAQVADDVFAAGGDVRVEGAEVDHAILAGASVTFRDSVARDVIAAASDLDVDGRILDDLIVAGMDVRVGDGTTVGGNAYVAAADARIGGRIDGGLKAAGNRVELSGTVLGNATLAGEDLSLAPGARVAGTLSYASDAEIRIAADAVVEGGIRRIEFERRQPGPFAALAGIVFGWVGLTLALLVLGAGVHFAAPRAVDSAAARLRRRPWASLGLGVLVLIVAPLLAVLLMVTVIGFPLALVLLALWFVALGVALVPTGRWLGGLLWRREPGGLGRRVLATLLGLLVLAVVMLIPFLGPVVALVAILFGLGAWFLAALSGRRGTAAA